MENYFCRLQPIDNDAINQKRLWLLPGLILFLTAPTVISLTRANGVAGLALVVLMIARHTSETTIIEICKDKNYCL